MKFYNDYIQYLLTLDRDEELSGGTAYDLAVAVIPQFLDWLTTCGEVQEYILARENPISKEGLDAIHDYLSWRRKYK